MILRMNFFFYLGNSFYYHFVKEINHIHSSDTFWESFLCWVHHQLLGIQRLNRKQCMSVSVHYLGGEMDTYIKTFLIKCGRKQCYIWTQFCESDVNPNDMTLTLIDFIFLLPLPYSRLFFCFFVLHIMQINTLLVCPVLVIWEMYRVSYRKAMKRPPNSHSCDQLESIFSKPCRGLPSWLVLLPLIWSLNCLTSFGGLVVSCQPVIIAKYVTAFLKNSDPIWCLKDLCFLHL